MKVILILILCILLTGCSFVYNLSNFVMPDDLEFLEVVETLDTPEKISDYMIENFTYELHPTYAISPYVLWQTKKGDCNDFSTFGVFIADYHGYETYQIKINLKNTLYCHYIAVYNEGLWSFTDNQYYYYGYDTFEEIVKESCRHIGYDYTSYEVKE